MRALLFALLLSLPFSLHAADENGVYTVGDLTHDCIKCSTDEKSPQCIYCNALITGTASTLNVFERGKSFCPPDNLDTHRARNAFRMWSKNGKNDEQPAVVGIVASLQTMYVCKK